MICDFAYQIAKSHWTFKAAVFLRRKCVWRNGTKLKIFIIEDYYKTVSKISQILSTQTERVLGFKFLPQNGTKGFDRGRDDELWGKI